MSAENQPSLGETLMSDAYWEGPVYDPFEGMSRQEQRQYKRARIEIYKDHEKAQEIGNVVLSLRGGGTMQTIPEGENLPLPADNPRQVVKVVADSRLVIPRFGRKPKFYPLLRLSIEQDEKLAAQGLPEGNFDFLAEAMTRATVYTQFSAWKMAKRSRDIVVIERSVSYVRAAGEDNYNLGAALSSHAIRENEIDERVTTSPLPHTTVGTLYKDTGRRHLTKIVAATLIEANGVRWTHGPGSSGKRNKTEKRLGWLPSLHPAS